ncbi:MAG: peptide deformylase [Patescibacteria group bacterium]|nr:peptide deformylase [Patescibacteria group bacterium]
MAAPQIGKSIRLIICKYFLNDDEYTIVEMINPEILKQSDTIQEYEEGCLSVPKVFEYIKRPSNITVKFTALDGEDYEIEAQGYNAQIIQHEIDHLEGILFTERM